MKLLYPYNVLIDLSANWLASCCTNTVYPHIYIFIWRFLKIFHSTFYDRENHLFASGGKNLTPLYNVIQRGKKFKFSFNNIPQFSLTTRVYKLGENLKEISRSLYSKSLIRCCTKFQEHNRMYIFPWAKNHHPLQTRIELYELNLRAKRKSQAWEGRRRCKPRSKSNISRGIDAPPPLDHE